MQINLQHSKTATDNFNQFTMEAALDIVFIQEPYIYKNQVTGISRKHRIFENVLLGISPASICSWPTFRNAVSVPSSKAGGRLWGVRGSKV